jgi:riboflavin biosynthesis pyrimidine reductase
MTARSSGTVIPPGQDTGFDQLVVNGPQQALAAGLVDELALHVAPVLIGSGIRLFDRIGAEHIKLEALDVVGTGKATHLRYAVVG